eukprot:gnl/MRDRNA2_/MRDRNA2_83703_c0_seq2.p1 gnl/MRDRNA2_/MRDRNA2_83703_c0~~gnl/MRDRNA2_/MRDRNA2_83703_c0_seq2.p1  ORF type:complete len:275 (+),score=42.14 gnl/MRDRNA2_/MRDRNA2_83703_c0_seq2:97-921(+)
MNSIGLLIPLAFISQAFATVEDDEAMNNLMDTLMNGDSNTTDQLLDVVAEKLVDKLLGFDVAMMPQRVAMMEPAAIVRPAPSFRASQPKAPALIPVAYDNSKNVKIGENREGVVASRNKNYNAVPASPSERWGTGASSNGRSANPYGVSYPENSGRPEGEGLKLNNNINGRSVYKPGPEYQNFGSGDYERLLGKEGFGAARPMDKALDTLQGLNRVDGGSKPRTMMEMDETDGPDAVSVIVTFLLSAFVGSAVTFALVRFRYGAKIGMRAPLLM